MPNMLRCDRNDNGKLRTPVVHSLLYNISVHYIPQISLPLGKRGVIKTEIYVTNSPQLFYLFILKKLHDNIQQDLMPYALSPSLL